MPWTQEDTSFKKLQNKRITTNVGKGIDEEKGASTLELYLPDIKTDLIPGTPPGATTSVLYYTGAIGQTLVVDTSVPNNLTWFATSGYGNTTAANDGSALSESQRLGDWISDKYDGFGTVSGAGYEIKVYDKNSNLITKADPSDWLFDYQTGILVFNNANTTYGAVSTSGPFRIVGYRYIGNKGLIPANYGGLGFTNYNLGDILVGAGSTFIKLPLGSNTSVLKVDTSSATGLTWGVAASSAVSSINGLTDSTQYFATGSSGNFFNIASSGSTHTFNIPLASTGATGLVNTSAQSFAGVKTFTNDTIISSSTSSLSSVTGALTVTGGVGIGGSLYTDTSSSSSISGVVLSNGVVNIGSWAGSAITAKYGGTGYTSYDLGDLVVGAGNTFIRLPVGINSYVLGADSSKPSGVGWTTVTPLTISDLAPSNAKNADLWFNSLDGGLLVYYKDINDSYWVEIALGSGIDLTQPLHITNSSTSTSTNTGALIVDGGAGIAGTVNAYSFSINEINNLISATLTTSTTTADQVALSLNSSHFRSAKLFIQMTSSTSYHCIEISMVHDDTTVYMNEYGSIYNNSILSTFDGDVNGGNMRLLVTPVNAVTKYQISCNAIRK